MYSIYQSYQFEITIQFKVCFNKLFRGKWLCSIHRSENQSSMQFIRSNHSGLNSWNFTRNFHCTNDFPSSTKKNLNKIKAPERNHFKKQCLKHVPQHLSSYSQMEFMVFIHFSLYPCITFVTKIALQCIKFPVVLFPLLSLFAFWFRCMQDSSKSIQMFFFSNWPKANSQSSTVRKKQRNKNWKEENIQIKLIQRRKAMKHETELTFSSIAP